MSSHIIAPSILAADFGKLNEEIELVNKSQAEWLHVDIMDGRFVPNISFGQVLMPFIQKASTKFIDVHLMIMEPQQHIDEFINRGANQITVHWEACPHLHRVIQQIKSQDAKAGVAINPHTPVELLEDILEMIDTVCVMSVNPGYGGQKFIYRTIPKVKRLKEMIIAQNLNTHIEIDGGVSLANAEVLLQAGADVLVAGSSVFKSDDPVQMIADLASIPEQKTY